MRAVFLLLVLSGMWAPAKLLSQVSNAAIEAAAFNYMLQKLGPDMATGLRIQRPSYCNFIAGKDSIGWKNLAGADTMTEQTTDLIIMRYKLDYGYPLCPAMDTMREFLTLTLNNALEITEAPDLSFMPDFVREHKKCDILDREEIFRLAKDKGLWCRRTDIFTFQLDYDKAGQFLYTIRGQYKTTDGQKLIPEMEFMSLDARTGKVMTYTNSDRNQQDMVRVRNGL
jgi:hypothetical protein